ncbi:MAG: hypothetical protein IH861_13425 [Chloroflexi bacterium]|nr:hypothetical protein [Chloroflexota bacterium]
MLTFVSELDVLVSTCRWLDDRGWTIDSISLAPGAGLPRIGEQKEVIRQEFEAAHIAFDANTLFRRRGADINARSGEIVWKFECKGMSDAQPQTHRTSFDRAVASVVSYYDNPLTRLGLAVANDYLWQYNYADRLPLALRKAIGLWVFLVLEGGATHMNRLVSFLTPVHWTRRLGNVASQ